MKDRIYIRCCRRCDNTFKTIHKYSEICRKCFKRKENRCDLCDKPIPLNRSHNAKSCSERCRKIIKKLYMIKYYEVYRK